MAHTPQVGRVERRYRHAIVASDPAEAIRKLRDQISMQASQSGPKLGLLFRPGAQLAGMATTLLRDVPFFADELGQADRILRSEVGLPLLQTLTERRPLDQTAILQPVLFAVEYALAKLLMHVGLSPAGLLGHSLGEYVAACLAEVFQPPSALLLVAERGRLMGDTPPGAMLSVPLGEAETQSALLLPGLDLAVINSSSQCVVSGELRAIEVLTERLTERGIEGRRLRTSNAFHSRLMEPILHRFLRAVVACSFALASCHSCRA